MFCLRCYRRFEDQTRFCPHDGEALATTPDVARLRGQCLRPAKGFIGEHYTLRGVLGEGDNAEVFLGEVRETHEPVAIKVLRAKLAKNPSLKARFFVEANAALKIDHPNVVKVLDVGLRTGGAPYIAMDFLFGESLKDRLRRDTKLRPEDGLPIVRNIAHGLQAAHKVGIVHRDIKPGNVFLIGEMGRHHDVKVVDFGMAKMQGQLGLTQAGTALGTPEYIAPEQAVGDHVDGRTDIYSLGITMYRMFSGALPYRSDDASVLLAHQLITPLPPPPPQVKTFPARLYAVVKKATRKNPDQRYPDVAALLADIDRVHDESATLDAHQPVSGETEYVPVSTFAQHAAPYLMKLIQK